jgi:hypothetical protein
MSHADGDFQEGRVPHKLETLQEGLALFINIIIVLKAVTHIFFV